MIKTLDTVLSSAKFAAADVVGDPPDLQELFHQHLDFVWRIARTAGLPPDDADDVAQEVFLVVHRRLHTFQAGRSMRAWLWGITRNVALQHLRAHTRREHYQSAAPPPPPIRDPDVSYELRQAAELMQQFLDRLDVDKCIVFMLADVEGLTAAEIADALAIPIGTVFSRLRAARLKLDEYTQRLSDQNNRGPHGQ